jgi:hypothetical protein
LSAHKPSTRIQHFGGGFFAAVMAPVLSLLSEDTLESVSDSPPDDLLPLSLLLLEGSTYDHNDNTTKRMK